jgi:Cof subfamily protein (haloacid dehalogenase superfamily)
MIRLVLSDLDGTLIDSKRELTSSTLQAVAALRNAGIAFTIVSGRPPLGMRFIARGLQLQTAFAAFNGGMMVKLQPKGLTVIEQLHLDPVVAGVMIENLDQMGLDTWLYRGHEWLIRDPEAPHVARERDNVRINPTVVSSFDSLHDRIIKIVGVSDDLELVARAERELRDDRCHIVMAARSQNYYLDITHADATKGTVVLRLASLLGISPTEIATLGDMPSDVRMFERSGISFAMGNASDAVKTQATRVVASNDNDGFAEAASQILEFNGAHPWLKKPV